MLIRLIPPSTSPHSTIIYPLTFPNVLSMQNLDPGAAIPAAWSSQLHLITSVLQLEPPSSIHMLDRAVGLVARTREVSLNVPQKEIVVTFVDGRAVSIPMNSDCVRLLLGVVLDVNGCSEPESARNSMESSAFPGSTTGSAEDLPSRSYSPTRSPKSGKHKRQRSLLFSLISSLVPKSLSPSSSASPPPTAPPPTPLPPLPATGRVTSLIQANVASVQPDPDLLRGRARATLVDVWRRHIISALTPQHLPAAGYAEWTLIAIASEVRAEIESINIEKFRSHGFGVTSKRTGGSGHRRTQSEGRNALDFGDRSDDYGSERCRAPSPFPNMLDADDTDRVVYPRRDQANEWGVRYADHPRPFDEANVFEVEFNGHNDSLLREHFTIGDDWDDDDEQLTFELDRVGRHGTGIDVPSSSFGDKHPHPADLGLGCHDDDGSRLADTAFDMSTPLIPSDVNDDEESDDSQVSLRTPEEGEELPLSLPLQESTQLATHSSQPPLVSRVISSRPRSRNASAQFASAPSMLRQASHSPSFSEPSVHDPDSSDEQVDEGIYSRCEYLERICTALEIVRSRAREEGWRLVRTTMIGDKNGWMDAETERSLEIKAKRRAWSSGIRIYAPYSSTTHLAPKVWDGSSSMFQPPTSPPGLTSSFRRIPRVHGPIVPTGLSLGIPVRRSPLAIYSWGADCGRTSTRSKHGILNPMYNLETIEGKRSSRVTFADSVTKLFPVCEDDSEDAPEPDKVNAVGFPQAVPLAISADGPRVLEGPVDNEDDPFCACPSRVRTRTTSMYVFTPTPSSPPSPVLPKSWPSSPTSSYPATVSGNASTVKNDKEGRLDASALLLQPLSSLSTSPPPQLPSTQTPLTSNHPFIPRPRAVSLPTTRPCSSVNKTRRTSFHHKHERYKDLSRAYASPPPEGPLVVSATPAPHEQFPRYAHVYSPITAGKKRIDASISGRKEMVFEQAGSGFTVGIEVALGRAEEGRIVW